MGFELTRFVGKIDEEFICVICTLVLENPVQSLCEHIFCNDCINEWLAKDETCPVCRKTVSKEVKPVARYFRNLLNKFDIKCDFESRGCEIVLKLEDLKDHIARRCAYNPNTEIVCDKGCNITISRQEYEANNCFSHLSKALKQLKDAQEEQTKIVNSLRWQICYNMNISVSEPNILEYGQWNDKGALALVQSIRPLTLDHASFKIEILTGGDGNIIAIGLTSKGYPINKQPGWLDGSIGYHGDDGNLFNASGGGEAFGPTWKSGDIIECGLKFPTDDTVPSSFFRSKSIMPVEVYFSINGRMLGTRPVKIPELGFFPTVGLRSKGGKVRYYDS